VCFAKCIQQICAVYQRHSDTTYGKVPCCQSEELLRQNINSLFLLRFLGLLASTGLRVGEALRLTLADVQLESHPPQLHVRETKFHKSRLVPLHPTTADALRRYATLRTPRDCGNASDAFFIGAQGQPLSYDALRRWFTTRSQQLGLAPILGGRRPTLHAMRHTFAVRRMQLWYQEGGDVQARLPHLSVYLGHVRPQESYWYLTATPDLLVAAAERFQGYAPTGGVQ